MLMVVLIWGANFSIVKYTLQEVAPLALTAIRFTVAAVLLLIILRVREGNLRVTRKEFSTFLWLGFIGNTLYQILFIYGLKMTTAANSALLISTAPVSIAVFGHLFGIERITRKMFGGIVLGIAGIAVVMAGRGAHVSRATLAGDALIVLSSLCWSIYTLGVRRYAQNSMRDSAQTDSPLRVTTWTIATGVPGLLIIGLPSLANTRWDSISLSAWGGLAYAALLALVVAYVLWNTSVQRVGSSRTAIFTCLTPIVAALVAWLVLGEQLTAMQAIGASLVIGGVLLAHHS